MPFSSEMGCPHSHTPFSTPGWPETTCLIVPSRKISQCQSSRARLLMTAPRSLHWCHLEGMGLGERSFKERGPPVHTPNTEALALFPTPPLQRAIPAGVAGGRRFGGAGGCDPPPARAPLRACHGRSPRAPRRPLPLALPLPARAHDDSVCTRCMTRCTRLAGAHGRPVAPWPSTRRRHILWSPLLPATLPSASPARSSSFRLPPSSLHDYASVNL